MGRVPTRDPSYKPLIMPKSEGRVAQASGRLPGEAVDVDCGSTMSRAYWDL